jgi:hypothetical protein
MRDKITILTILAFCPVPAAVAQPTYSGDIAPIVYENCTSCHRPGQAGPFSLTNYKDVSKRARQMLEVMEDRFMPPWKPVPGHGEFQDALTLTDTQIKTFRQWVDNQHPEGDPKKAPPLPKFSDDWQLGKPDLVVTMDSAFSVPADGPDIYRNFVIPLDLPEDKWVKAVDLRPSDRSVVHHVLIFLDDTGRARELDKNDGQPGFKEMSFRRSGSLGGYVPGAKPLYFPGDLALPLKKGSDLILAAHFHPVGKATNEKSTIGIYFADKPSPKTIIPIQVPPAFGIGMGIDIPPGDATYRIQDSFTLPADVEAFSVGGHAHYVCKDMRMTATFLDGITKPMLYIDDWDLNWQGSYLFKEPIKLPKGTILKTELTYDNSAGNPRNPHSPPQRIRWGKESTDEMGSITLQVTADDESNAKMIAQAVKRKTGKNAIAQISTQLKDRLEGVGVTKGTVLSFLDKNHDGMIQKSEAPERLKKAFSQIDKNASGVLEEHELEPVVTFLKNRRK